MSADQESHPPMSFRFVCSLVPLAIASMLTLAVPVSAQEGDGGRPSSEVLARQFNQGVEAYDAKRYARAFELWLPLAQNGDLAAQRNVAHMLRRGQGVDTDMKRARNFYRQAAEFGFVTAQTDLGLMLLSGEGGDKDEEEAAYWLDRAARGGHPLAQFHLAQLYETGRVEAPNPGRALGWYALSARAGYEPALDRLAELVMILPGPSTDGPPEIDNKASDGKTEEGAEVDPRSAPPTDENEAAGALKADPPADQDPVDITTSERPLSFPNPTETGASSLPDGQDAYAQRDFDSALARFEARAYRGDADAQYLLGRMRNRGEGETRDPVAALAWWRLAARGGNENASRAADTLAKELGPRRRREAEREEAQFKALIDQMTR